MLAHLKRSEVGIITNSDGSLVSLEDIAANDLSDKLAKRAVDAHRVTPGDATTWKEQFAVAEARAKWIGVATYEANNLLAFPFRDSEAARWRANAARRARDNARVGVDGRRRRAKRAVIVSVAEGGHDVRHSASGKGWFCMACRSRAVARQKLSTTRCRKAIFRKCADNVVQRQPNHDEDGVQAWGSGGHNSTKRHNIAYSG